MLSDIAVWLAHFEHHAARPCDLPAEVSDVLTAEERRAIASSMATFQLGEQSDGTHLLRSAEHFARAHDMPALVPITRLLIREEQRHAALLRNYMAMHSMSAKQRDWTDTVFRLVRRLAGFELCVSVLITAELIGIVYYRALELATESQRLRMLCRTMVADELSHVAFEAELLLALRARRPGLLGAVLRPVHRAFFAGAALVVWHTHRAVFRRAGHDRSHYLHLCDQQYAFYLDSAAAAAESISAR
jgi:hypothetical protein